MKRNVVQKLEGYAVYNKCMPTGIERFFNNKELCEKFIEEHHSHADIRCVKATLYYEIPEDEILCNQGPKCSDNVCYCDENPELIK